MSFIFYIGHIEGTIAKLKEQAINLSTCEILNDPNKLYKRLKVLCNHEDLQKVPSEVNKLEEEANDPDWSDFFPHLQSVKSESFKHFK